ncbi:DinB family protein [Laceyella sacchari]|jgi:hypothetical protein|uniref:DinB family protein n=1 Tax=Laceyella sacchari TaxID=37482 RepID=A0ABY5TXX5_LACSH|nr:DinB family protein [Laceyella sacchari]TCW41640.1 DinB family protein [Laceyella sacchari]UWE02266.1 DinB family protein [Laceyella sacchari]
MERASFQLDDVTNILARTPKVLRQMLEGLPDAWIHCNEGEGTWSPFEVLGHLIHGEKTDWIQRIQIIVGDGDEKTFVPFDRTAHLHVNRHKSLETLLDEFEAVRNKNVRTLKTMVLTEHDLNRTGKHPELGVVTLRELLATWAVHDLSHVQQIVRVMAKHYHDEVGPWKAYLGILQSK